MICPVLAGPVAVYGNTFVYNMGVSAYNSIASSFNWMMEYNIGVNGYYLAPQLLNSRINKDVQAVKNAGISIGTGTLRSMWDPSWLPEVLNGIQAVATDVGTYEDLGGVFLILLLSTLVEIILSTWRVHGRRPAS